MRLTLLCGVGAAAGCMLALAGAAPAGAQAPLARSSIAACVPATLNVSAVLPGTSLAVSPLPDSLDASPHTQISLLGVSAAALRAVQVSGSQTGAHPGILRPYSQGDGASFLPRRPFRSGETVFVRGTILPGPGAAAIPFAYRFAVARQDVLPRLSYPHRIAHPEQKQHFYSRPDLQPPALVVSARSTQTAAGYLFAAPYSGPGASGPMIFDEGGSLVWFDPLPPATEATNLQVQQLGGRPVLTWWQGSILPQGFGQGDELIYDASYREIGRVQAGNGYRADLHDFHITPQSTALLTVFNPIDCNLAAHRGPSEGAITDTLFQEVDLPTGLVRREWHSLDHVPLSDSYSAAPGTSTQWPLDYFHLNSIEQLANATTLISARNTWALYQLSTSTGQVLTRIGGKRSDVRLLPGAGTAYQHDASVLADGTIEMFDNGADPKIHGQSRGVVVAIDIDKKTDTSIAQYEHPSPLSAGSQGNIQRLANEDVFIGWGAAPYFSEFSASGQLLFDAHMAGTYQSYRSYRFPWTGAPAAAPALAVVGAGSAPPTAYASWNGDTRTAAWRLLGGASAAALTALATAPRSGFETAIAAPQAVAYLAVQALDASGAVLATSPLARG